MTITLKLRNVDMIGTLKLRSINTLKNKKSSNVKIMTTNTSKL